MTLEKAVLEVFRRAAEDVPAYRQLLAEAGAEAGQVRTLNDFQHRVPLLDKSCTFERFPLADLCRGGTLGNPAWVLTSSGHSGRFAFGVYDPEAGKQAAERIDDALDAYLGVRSLKTLLVNCLPMGVKVYTRACTLAETSVREDMVAALIKGVAPYYDQTVLVGETAFIKRVLEGGGAEGIDWARQRIHVIVGEEPLAENARTYLAGLLGIDPEQPETGRIVSTMGVAELGLNLFYETQTLIALRRTLHRDPALRRKVLGPDAQHVPMLFASDPGRIFVELANTDRLVVTMLDPDRRIPLIRYATGDQAEWLELGSALPEVAERAGVSADDLDAAPVLMVRGRGQYLHAGQVRVHPEQVKEGLYHDAELARETTANFRMRSAGGTLNVSIQLAPGVPADPALQDRYADAIRRYVPARIEVSTVPYSEFRQGMSLDYERKFDYLQDA